MNTVTKLS